MILQDSNPITGLLVILEENIIAIIICLAVVGYILLNQWRKMRDAELRNVRTSWKAITSRAVKITSAMRAKIAMIEEAGQVEMEGDIYLIDSITTDEVIESKKMIPISLETSKERILSQMEDNDQLVEKWRIRTPIIANNLGNTENPDSLADIEPDETPLEYEETIITLFDKEIIASKLPDLPQDSDCQLVDRFIIQKQRKVVPQKTDTYVSLRRTKAGGEIIAFRRKNMQEHETIVSEATAMPLIELDPEIAQSHLRIALFGVMVYEMILMYMIITETPPTILMDRGTWPWYVVLLLAFMAKYWIDKTKIAFYAFYRGYLGADETFKLKGRAVGTPVYSYTTKVYEIELHAHPAIPLANLLKFNPDEIKDERVVGLESRVTALSTENSSLKAKQAQLLNILEHKDQQLDEARDKHLESFDDGVIWGVSRYQVSLPQENNPQMNPMSQQKQGPDTLAWFKELRPLIILGIILVGAWLIITNLGQWLNEISIGGTGEIFSMNILLGLGLVIVAIFIVVRATK